MSRAGLWSVQHPRFGPCLGAIGLHLDYRKTERCSCSSARSTSTRTPCARKMVDVFRNLHAVRLGLFRRRDVPARTDRQSLRSESVFHVSGMNCHPCARNGPTGFCVSTSTTIAPAARTWGSLKTRRWPDRSPQAVRSSRSRRWADSTTATIGARRRATPRHSAPAPCLACRLIVCSVGSTWSAPGLPLDRDLPTADRGRQGIGFSTRTQSPAAQIEFSLRTAPR